MPVSSASRRSLFLLFKCVLCECALCLGLSLSWLQSSSWAQEPPAKPAAKEAASPKPKPQTAPARTPDTRPSEPPPVLQQLNSALQGLVTKVSPAVVQVLVTGYGALSESTRAQTALLAPQPAVGPGAIPGPARVI